MQSQNDAIAVLGGGVIGLSSAIVALELGHSVDVFVWRDRAATTSGAAGASFKPAAVDDSAEFDETLRRSWRRFGEVVDRFGATETGVRRHTHWEASSSELVDETYLRLFTDVRYAIRPDVPGGYAYGRCYTTFLVDTPVYLPWLEARLIELGGRVIDLAEPLRHASDLSKLPGAAILNCTGFGSASLFGDSALVPVKGQTVQVGPRPDMTWSISADGFYIYPRSADTVLGGTAQYGDATTEPEAAVTELLLRANRRILPDIGADDVIDTSVGVRPFRRGGVRLDTQKVGDRPVIHNYGHGGAGVTLSWGSAELAVAAAEDAIA